ncbi:hypothetical protein C7M61_002850 [Candidozyma pseudohaemuli]|uniref:Uncharacterized protein n=1 Tax=Candidozyma pseudohaemuli TaxID=418784 RepID=A0A2P7YQP6_9ASCO|nr:hypothetical protein C7M61_002850 [[Candida] pseudohaemulonii]PSK38291.1 hypothetical protein C7M61_002850 [[Candida] pseudohaemulonii]
MFLFSPSRSKYLEPNPISFSTESEESEEFELFQLSTSKWASLPFIRAEGSTKSEEVFEEENENLEDLSEEESELLFMGIVPKKRVTKLGTFCKRSCSSLTAGLLKKEYPNLNQKPSIDLQSCSVSKVSFKIPSMETTAELTESSEEPVSNVLHPSGESTNTRSLIWRNLSFRRLLSHKSEGSYGSLKQESRTSTSNKASKPRSTAFMPRAFRLQPPKRPSKTYTWLGRAVLNFRSSVNMRAASGFDFGDSNAWPA